MAKIIVINSPKDDEFVRPYVEILKSTYKHEINQRPPEDSYVNDLYSDSDGLVIFWTDNFEKSTGSFGPSFIDNMGPLPSENFLIPVIVSQAKVPDSVRKSTYVEIHDGSVIGDTVREIHGLIASSSTKVGPLTHAGFALLLLDYLKSLKPGQQFGQWNFFGETDIAYSTPAGRWDLPGFQFDSNRYSFILKSILSNDSSWSYIVVESNNLEGQLVNHNIGDPNKFINNNGRITIREMYDMTAGHGRRSRETVRQALESVGMLSDIITEFPESAIPWPNVIFDILEWSARREEAKKKIIQGDRGRKYWLLKVFGINWDLKNLRIGNLAYFSALDAERRPWPDHDNFKSLRKGDQGLAYDFSDGQRVVFTFEVARELGEEDVFYLEITSVTTKEITSKDIGRYLSEVDLSESSNKRIFEIPVELFDLAADSDETHDSLAFTDTAARQSNDSAHSDEDHLGFDHDVKVFAALIALKSFEPPLAIALFGKWGSGKSFFMHHLEKRIKELSRYQGFLEDKGRVENQSAGETAQFCRGIVQVKFNAWSYLDTNLWAGLVASIFEKFDEFLLDYTKGEYELAQTRKILTKRLHILSEQESTLVAEKKILEDEKRKLEELSTKIKSEGEQLQQHLIETTPAKILSELEEAKIFELGLFEDLKKLGVDTKDIDVSKAEKVRSETASYGKFFRYTFMIPGPWRWLVFVLPVIIVLLFIYRNEIEVIRLWAVDVMATIVTGAAIIIKALMSYYKKYKPLLEKLEKFKDELNLSASEINQRVAAVRQEIQTRISSNINQQSITDKKLNVARAEIESLSGSISAKAFSNFIAKRMGSRDYEDKIGIISIVRRDLETLSGIFEGVKSKDDTVGKKIQSKKADERDEKLEEDKRTIREQFESHPIERIVLYIDDLDRCDDAKVLEVLQAVHLLMAFPLFIVVVGVDPRCVTNALNYRNVLQYSQFTLNKSPRELEEIFDIKVVRPQEYLEKIFQIPFFVKDPERSGVEDLIESLFVDQLKEEEPQNEVKPVEDHRDVEDPKTINDLGNDNEFRMSFSVNESTIPYNTTRKPEVPKTIVTPQMLNIGKDELIALQKISRIVGTTPRTIKRFVNMYRLVRAHGGNISFKDATGKIELTAMMLLLAIQSGKYSNESHKFSEAILKSNGTLEKALNDSGLQGFKDLLMKGDSVEDDTMIKPLLYFNCDVYKKHLSFIRRFTFGFDILKL